MAGLEREPTRARGAAPGFKVAILGAAGGIGQPLSLLMKMYPLVSTLHLYDVFNTPGVVADLSHTNTSAVVRFFVTLSNFKFSKFKCSGVCLANRYLHSR